MRDQGSKARVICRDRQRVPATKRRAPQHEAPWVDLVEGAHVLNDRTYVLAMLSGRDHASRFAATVAKAAVVEQERREPRLDKSLGKSR